MTAASQPSTIRRRGAVQAAALFLTLALLLLGDAGAQELPQPSQWVTDSASLLSSSEQQRLNEKLRAFEQRSGVQFLVYIAPSFGEGALEDTTVRAVEQWKIWNQKGFSKGIVLFVFPQDRAMRFEVGYEIEGTVTDAASKRILDQTLRPRFRQNDFYGGIDAATDQIIARVEGKAPPEPSTTLPAQGGQRATPSIGSIWPFFLILLIFLFVIGPMLRRGGCGGCGGCWPLFFFPGGGGGVTFGGGSGGFGGGGFGGGGFGGGFGGGGSFGGGGASGSW